MRRSSSSARLVVVSGGSRIARQRLAQEQGARQHGREPDDANGDRRQGVGKGLEEPHAAEDARVLRRGISEGAANERADEDSQVPRDGEPGEGTRLGLARGVLRDHGAHGDDAAGEDAGGAAEDYHLGDGPGEAEEGGRHRDAQQREDEHGLAADAVGGPAPGYHDEHLREREQGLDEARVEAHVGLVDAPAAVRENHLVDVGEYGEEGHRLDEPGVAEE